VETSLSDACPACVDPRAWAYELGVKEMLEAWKRPPPAVVDVNGPEVAARTQAMENLPPAVNLHQPPPTLWGCNDSIMAAAVPAAPLISDFVMTVLSNSRHEAFARAILQGKSGREAYIAAGYKAAGAEANASRLIRNDKVSARIAELKGKAAEGAVATARQVLEELTRIGLANIRDYVGAHGQVVDVSQLTREQTAAIQEVTVDTYMDGGGENPREVKKVKFKLADKRAALVALGRHHKLFTDKFEHGGKDGHPIEGRITIEFVDPPKRQNLPHHRGRRPTS
jgi:phage terminase small subunit